MRKNEESNHKMEESFSGVSVCFFPFFILFLSSFSYNSSRKTFESIVCKSLIFYQCEWKSCVCLQTICSTSSTNKLVACAWFWFFKWFYFRSFHFFILLLSSHHLPFFRLLSILIIHTLIFKCKRKNRFSFSLSDVTISLINHSNEITLNESAIHKLLRQRNGMPWHEMKIDRVSRIRAYGEWMIHRA